MKTIIQGKNLKTTYGIDYKWKTIKNDKGDDVTVYIGKPKLTKKTELIEWETIAEVDEKIEYNSSPIFNINSYGFTISVGKINLSEDEVVNVEEKITRVDLGAYVLHTDKVLHEEIVLKEDSEETLVCQIKAFNKMMIESNEKLSSYCKLHKLNPEETDVDELFKLVYPNKTYSIRDGKLELNEVFSKEYDCAWGTIGAYAALDATVTLNTVKTRSL
ncbi:hypothetical protein KQI61_06025 [Anaerocolumna aminovalerica]|uniref:hypothetical protein n=1 Tax=Anaerocolumna aminovalerica TaxID=1527 RepID=UPI001C0ED4FC|nr:hypothetical protein [Anaerocolumna aminovalerica]MBU5331748.1 hypothetical protein [Anaerocolumna aminovalerica]